MNHPCSRRHFLGRTLWGGALAGTLPSFVAATFEQLRTQAETHSSGASSGADAPILVVLQLAGGNDGLNTVIPHTNDDYHRARPKLGIPSDQVLRLTDTLGLHPSLVGFKSLYDEGHLGIVQAVGYPNPNRSHFRSTDIWMTASDSEKVSNRGWLGHYFDHACAGADPTVGIAIGRQSPLAFAADKPTGIALENPEAFRFVEGQAEAAGQMGSEKYYRQLNQSEASDSAHEIMASGASIGAVGGSHPAMTGSPLDFLERTSADAQSSSDQIRGLAARSKNLVPYPTTRLANDLKLVARLIGGHLPTRVYYVSQGGFDTHTNQLASHQRLLGELGDATKAFLADLKAMGELNRVLLMTFSEFGRRVAENASGGTDHGAAAPIFVAGGRVRAGIHGEASSLAPADLLNGDVRFQTDFRSLYGTILEGWLGTPAAPILGRGFPQVKILG